MRYKVAKKRTTIIKWSILLLMLGYVSWVTVWAHQEAARHLCKGVVIEIDGCEPEREAIVRRGVQYELERSGIEIKGRPLGLVDAVGIERKLSALNNFESVECMLTSDEHLRVRVKPMVPVMRVFTSSKSFYINKDGKVIEARPEFYCDVPIVKGNFGKGFSPVRIFPLVRFVSEDETLRELVSMIEAPNEKNLLLVPRIQGHVINFGDTSRLSEKRDALLLFYKKVLPHRGWNEYDTISVKFRGQVVATRRNKTLLNASEMIEDEDLDALTVPDSPVVADAEESASPVAEKQSEKPAAQKKSETKQSGQKKQEKQKGTG